MNNQVYISQLSTYLCFYKVLFEVKKIDVRLNKTSKLKFILMLFDSVYLTRPCDTVTKYTIYPTILLLGILFKCSWVILLLCRMARKTWLKNVLHFTFWDRIFARVCFYKSSSYYLEVATAKIPNLKIFPLIASKLFDRNLSIVHPTLFLIS